MKLLLFLFSIQMSYFLVNTCTTGEVRLVNGTTPDQGRVEICINGVWGTVCDDNWNYNNARVVCRQLGYNTDDATYFRGPDHNYGSGNGSIFLDGVRCFGNEYNLLGCLHYPIGSHHCDHSEDVAVSCFLACFTGEVRLANGTTANQGRVEICINGVWGTVCDDDWNYNNARVVCRQLGYNTDGATYFRGPDHNYGSGNGSIFLDGVRCFGNEYNLLGCLHNPIRTHNCDHSKDVAVSCSLACFTGEVRLVNGTTPNQGRVEICINGVWGTVCDDLWTNNSARVVCRQLGYNTDGATYFRGPDHNYGSGTGSIFLDEVQCFGNEYNLLACLHYPIGSHNCDHSEDVAVSCSLDTCESLPSPTPSTVILTVTNSFCEPPSSSPFNLSSITVTTIPITVTATATVESTAAIMSAIILPIILLMIIVLLISLTLIFYYYKIRKAVNRKPVSGKRTLTAKLDDDVVFNIRYNDTNQQISCSQFTSLPLPAIPENQVSDGTNDQDYTTMDSSCNHIYQDATKI
ncbi:PREDICTED: neurotrypsin-like [Amphimedon queenslandica]|uniref:SRCR domain-containing protein n=1 Tax=Amphimedon queenslandica TaxID=400682 RepID=A0AAN0J027_AMPQE|nr:PREDICTED: neurotrypsin-like [Amphimedon queenslandica]|eukprot:XP_019850360.1 PREDICTED: neurotrypsin-like [Amphimedon queenslandica]